MKFLKSISIKFSFNILIFHSLPVIQFSDVASLASIPPKRDLALNGYRFLEHV
jgi:hypothetical protein